MISINDKVTFVVAACEPRGFRYVRRGADNWVVLRGPLKTAGASHECELEFDPEFMELPRVRLLEVPASLRPVAPHVSSSGGLCFIAQGTVVLDIFDPAGQMLACIDRAEEVLGCVLAGKMVADLEEEFFAYWGNDRVWCMVDTLNHALGRQESFFVPAEGHFFAVVTDDPARTKTKMQLIGWPIAWAPVPTFRVRTQAKPRPKANKWPPSCVGDILDWQGLLDPRCRKKIQQRISEAARTNAGGVLILVESPLLTYGFAVNFRRKELAAGTRKRAPTTPELFGFPVIPMNLMRLDERYLSERNTPGRKTLFGKNIAVVGCGTIGGYLADMLVKAGAGTGGGTLTLVDPDSLYPQNVGRHRLGFASLFQNKANALRIELKYGAPGAEIRALPVKIQEAQLSKLDLLIDATGEEALGHWIVKTFGPGIPQLHIWIEGAGVAVRGLLKNGTAGACFRCLTSLEQDGLCHSVKGEVPVVQAGQGCEGLYVPFPAHVSVQAASLGAEMTLDWVNEVQAPALRTRVVNSNFELATPDCSPDAVVECPACSC